MNKKKSQPREAFPLFILASTSPRRISLLEQVQLPAQVYAPDSEEKMEKGEVPARLVVRLAKEKALSVKAKILKLHPDCLILAADTIVVDPTGRRVLGKPKTRKQAEQMLKALAGKTHTVLTGYCLMESKRRGVNRVHTRVVKSRVKMRPLSPLMIRDYVASGEPLDKAGSYGAQGLGTAFVESITGSYTNVVGLPITQVLLDLEMKFGIPLFSWAQF